MSLLCLASASADTSIAGAVSELRAQGDYRQAEMYAANEWRREDLPDRERAELAIQLALVYTDQALASAPALRDALWTKADAAYAAFIESWPDNSRRALVDVQHGLVGSARGQQTREAGDTGQAVEQLRVARRILNDVADRVARELIELRLRPNAARSPDAFSVAELESLEQNISLHLARAERQLGLCYPPGSADRDDALLQAVRRLAPLAQQTRPDELTWNARIELVACQHDLGRGEVARKLAALWLKENPPPEIAQQLADEPSARPPLTTLSTTDAFAASINAAALERQAGNHAAVADALRRLAIKHPDHTRAAEAHRLAILSMADVLRESAPADRDSLSISYEELLNEHLNYWPKQPLADEVRLWLAQLLIARRNWTTATELLRQAGPTSQVYADSMRLLARCYTEQLHHFDQQKVASQNLAQLLSAATSNLQPVITGADNRWPEEWSELQLDMAVALARLNLQFAPQTTTYAERLLGAALRGRHVDSPVAESYVSTARLLLVETLVRSGKAAEALGMAEELNNAPTDAILETLDRTVQFMQEDLQAAKGDQREIGEFALALVRLLSARRNELEQTAAARLDTHRAAAFAATGDRDAALAQYRALAAELPKNADVQEQYAGLLAISDSPTELRQALAQWQTIESRSQPGGPRWRRARQTRIDLLTRLGDQSEADKLLRLTRLLYPDWRP